MDSESENVPDEDKIYRRIIPANFKDGKILPVAFSENKGGMSTEWDRYSTPEETQIRAFLTQEAVKKDGKKPRSNISKKIAQKNGVVHFIAKDVRDLQLEVEHTHTKYNPGHTDVRGIEIAPNPEKIRYKLMILSKWEIRVS